MSAMKRILIALAGVLISFAYLEPGSGQTIIQSLCFCLFCGVPIIVLGLIARLTRRRKR